MLLLSLAVISGVAVNSSVLTRVRVNLGTMMILGWGQGD